MNEPQKYSMETGLPIQKDNLKIPMPKLYPEAMSDDIPDSKPAEKSFWEFIAKHEESRQDWLNKKYEQQNHSKGNKT